MMSDQPESETFKFFAWNIDQARREESFEPTKWDNRSHYVKALIDESSADVIALIELRDLETSKESARQFLSDPIFHKYDVVHRRYCHYNMTFHMALLFDPKRFFVGNVNFYPLGKDPQTSKAVMFVDLQSKKTLKYITIGVTYFDLDEQIKWDSVKTLKELIEFQHHPCMVYGDYNFFDDRDGTKQRESMLVRNLDLAYPLRWLMHDGAYGPTLSGTFMGFPHDEFKKSYGAMSRLDHIFTPMGSGLHKGIAISPFLSDYSLDNSTYATYNYPSDHLAILVDITITK
jgi:Endonuclease/Exonuclease/phosphatase family